MIRKRQMVLGFLRTCVFSVYLKSSHEPLLWCSSSIVCESFFGEQCYSSSELLGVSQPKMQDCIGVLNSKDFGIRLPASLHLDSDFALLH